MLIRFSVENFRSFRERTYLSFVPGPEQRHPDHVVPAKAPEGFPLLKLAVLYGANASGKSNLVQAIATAQQIILKSAEAGARLPVQPFKLDAEWRNQPTRFEFEIRLGERNIAYGFVASAERVVEEWLYEIGKDSEKAIFERKESFSFPGIAFRTEEERQFLQFTARGTLPNRLLLTECRERNLAANVPSASILSEVLDWFASRLTVLFPEMEFSGLDPLVSADSDFRDEFRKILQAIDTGIQSVEMKDVPLDDAPWMTKEEQTRILETLPKDRVLVVRPSDVQRYLVFRGEQGKLRAQKMVFKHAREDRDAEFERAEESDGTRRFMDLVPALLILLRTNRVFIIDEFDRSLHPEVAHSFLANFLHYSGQRESQLVVTTHETTLMDRDFLRRDEIWLVEKGQDQASRLVSLVEYKEPPEGADLRQDYLNGRYGGVPVLRDFHWLGSAMARERRDFVRRSGFRDASLVVIACEGAVTEPEYFEDVKAQLHAPGLHVEVLQREDAENSSPQCVLRMLNDFANRFRLRDGDTLWLVLDRDPQSWKPAMISEVSSACLQKGYRFTLSNPCFELWLLLHFEDVPVQPDERRGALFANEEQLLKGLVATHRNTDPGALDVHGPAAGEAIRRARALDVNPDARWPDGLGTLRVHLLIEHLLNVFRQRTGSG